MRGKGRHANGWWWMDENITGIPLTYTEIENKTSPSQGQETKLPYEPCNWGFKFLSVLGAQQEARSSPQVGDQLGHTLRHPIPSCPILNGRWCLLCSCDEETSGVSLATLLLEAGPWSGCCLFVCFVFVFRGRVFLGGTDWPGARSVDQAALKLTRSTCSASWVLGLKAHATIIWLRLISYTVWDHQPRGGTTRNVLAPPTSVTN